MIYKASFLMAALIGASQANEQEFSSTLRSLYEADERMEMIFQNASKYHANLDFTDFQKTQPVWGIATTEVFSPLMNTSTFKHPHFTWETNVNFIHYAGSWAVPIRYDLSDEDLYALLDSVNGVFLAGGATDMIDFETGEQSVFYQTQKRIWDYMKRQKDEKDIDFPIFGICQGFEMIHYLANNDDKDTLSTVKIFNQSRPIKIAVDKIEDYKLFSHFPEETIKEMQTENLAFHAHRWVITKDTYDSSEALTDFFHVLATDEEKGKEFVVAVEGKHYPVTGVMFHPETQQRHTVSTSGQPDGAIIGKVNDKVTDAINYYFSQHVRDQGEKTLETHRFEDAEFGKRMEWLNTNLGLTTSGVTSFLPSYGF